MSNKPPKINPTGTRFSKIPVFAVKGSLVFTALHSQSYQRMMRIVNEYIAADFEVEFETTSDVDRVGDISTFGYKNSYLASKGQQWAFVTCKPPLLAAAE